MATNEILKFGQTASNILSQVAYNTDPQRDDGVSGVARANLQNKFQRQVSTIAAGIAQFIADYNSTDDDVTDILTAEQIGALFLDALSNAPLTTQPQFDDSQKAATTEFVQRALGSLAGSAQYAVNTILTAADVGKIVSPTVGGLGFDLPLVSTLPDGAQLFFNGNGHGCVVSRQGSDVINNGSAGPISVISVNDDDMLGLTVINGTWTVTSGNEQLNTSSQFECSLVTNGYEKSAGGVIRQWGTVVTGAGGTLIGSFPIAFPAGCLNFKVSANSVNLPGSIVCVAGTALSATQFQVFAGNPVSGVGESGQSIEWSAVGH